MKIFSRINILVIAITLIALVAGFRIKLPRLVVSMHGKEL